MKSNKPTPHPENASYDHPLRAPRGQDPDIYCAGARLIDNMWYAEIYDGYKAKHKRNSIQRWPEKGCNTESEAIQDGQARVKQLLQAAGKWKSAPASQVNGSLHISIEDAMTAIVVAKSLPQPAKSGATPIIPKNNTINNLRNGKRVILLHLPAKSHQLPMAQLKPEEFEAIAKGIESGTQGRNTKKKYFQDARKMCRELHAGYGLDEKFEKALPTPHGMDGKRQPERPFTATEMKTLQLVIQNPDPKIVTETVEGICLFGTVAMFQPVDVALFRWQSAEEQADFLAGPRMKTSTDFHLLNAAPLKNWLARRKAKGGVWHGIYVFPELHFTPAEMQKSGCNQEKFEGEELEKRKNDGAKAVSDLFRGLLNHLEMKRPGLSFSSFRHYLLQYLKSHGVSDRVLLSLAGHADLKSLGKYGGSGAEWEIVRAGNLLQKHLHNLVGGCEEKHVVTPGELAEYMDQKRAEDMQVVRELFSSFAAEFHREFQLLRHEFMKKFGGNSGSANSNFIGFRPNSKSSSSQTNLLNEAWPLMRKFANQILALSAGLLGRGLSSHFNSLVIEEMVKECLRAFPERREI
ncbi:MAG: hypothetical protein QM813_03185 [Verrucomicrobiota bacterium]